MKHYKQLTGEQRHQISGLKKAGLNQSQIADEVGVHKSTISREFKRNKGRRGWRPRQAQELRDERRKQCVNARRLSLLEWAEVERLIRLDMSPEQASFRLALECGLGVSHEAIYELELELSPFDGHIKLCVKEKEDDSEIQTCIPRGISPADGGISCDGKKSQSAIQRIWLSRYFDTSMVPSGGCSI